MFFDATESELYNVKVNFHFIPSNHPVQPSPEGALAVLIKAQGVENRMQARRASLFDEGEGPVLYW
jgi:hypothetical protein